MSTGYTKQSTYANGNVISATLFNNDFGKLEDAFSYSTDPSETGHTHDGSSGQGGAIGKIGDPDFNNKIQIDGTNNLIKFFVEVDGTTSTEILNVSESGLIPVVSNVGIGTTANPFSTANITTVTATSLTVNTDTLHVDSSNNRVGIGTTSPDFPLHLKNTNPRLVIQDTDGTNQYAIISHSSGTTTITTRNGDSSGELVFARSSGTPTTSMKITSSGFVAIGTINNPSARLHVSQSTNNPTGILTNNNTSGSNGRSFVTAQSTNGEITLTATSPGYTTVESWQDSGIVSTDSDLSGGLILHAGANDIKFQSGSTHTERMRITSAGRVGIGTDDPSAPLDIASSYPSIRLTSLRNDNDWTNNALLGKIEFYSSDTSSIAATRAQILALAEDVNGTTAGLQFSVGDTPIPRMWIKAGGSVGIGASSPNHKLHVHGGDIMISSESNLNSDGKPALLFSEQSHVNTGSNDSSAGIVYDGAGQTGDAKYLGLGVWDNSQDDQDTLAEQKATTTLNITRDNKVGIGTITPTETLDIEDTDLANSVTLKVKNLAEATDDTTLPSSELKLEADGATGTITVEGVGSSDSSLGKVSINGTVGKPLTFGTGVNEHARFSGGNFLINHEVMGTIQSEQGVALTASGRGYFTSTSTANDAVLQVTRFDVDSGQEYISFDYQDTTNNLTGSLGAIKVYANNGLSLQTQNQARLASTSSNVSLSSNSAELILSNGLSPHGNNDGTITLGTSAARFGGIFLAQNVELVGNSANASTQFIRFHNDDNRIAYIRADYSAAEAGNGTGITIATNPSQGTSVERLKVSEDGDITFFATDGTTSGVFWDASEKQLGLNTTSLVSTLNVESADTDASLATFGSTTQTDTSRINLNTDTAAASSFIASYGSAHATEAGNMTIQNTEEDGELFFVAGNNEGIRIDTDGNVGIKNNDPSEALDVTGTVKASTGFVGSLLSTENTTLTLTADSDEGAVSFSGITLASGENNVLAKFLTYDNTVQFFDTSGNVKLNWTSGTSEGLSIGTGNPATEMLDVTGNIAVSGTVDGVDIATLNSNAIVDGDFTSEGLMKRDATSGSYSIVTDNSSDWDTAHGWGNHASAGYLTASDITGKANLSGADFTGNVTTTGTLATGGYTLSSTDGTEGQALVTDGSGNVSFGNVVVDVSGKADLSGDTFTGDVTLSDDIKLKFGNATDGDLRLHHDSSNHASYIVHDNVGDLHVESDSLFLRGVGGGRYLYGDSGGEVKLYYNNSEKFNTRDDGVDVTGNMYATGIADSYQLSVFDTGVVGADITDYTDSLGRSGNTKTVLLVDGNTAGKAVSIYSDNSLYGSSIATVRNTNVSDDDKLFTLQIQGNKTDTPTTFSTIASTVTDAGNTQAELKLDSETIKLEASDVTVTGNLSVDGSFNLSQLDTEVGSEGTEQIHNNTVYAGCIYDTAYDVDGGSWRNKTTSHSWYLEDADATYRSATKKFPKKVAIDIRGDGKIYIYDITKSGNPMWKVIPPLNYHTSDNASYYYSTANHYGQNFVQAKNGKLFIKGDHSGSDKGLIYDFAEDRIVRYLGSSNGASNTIEICNSGKLTHDDTLHVDRVIDYGISYSEATSAKAGYADFDGSMFTNEVGTLCGLPKASVYFGCAGAGTGRHTEVFHNETDEPALFSIDNISGLETKAIKVCDRKPYMVVARNDNDTYLVGYYSNDGAPGETVTNGGVAYIPFYHQSVTAETSQPSNTLVFPPQTKEGYAMDERAKAFIATNSDNSKVSLTMLMDTIYRDAVEDKFEDSVYAVIQTDKTSGWTTDVEGSSIIFNDKKTTSGTETITDSFSFTSWPYTSGNKKTSAPIVIPGDQTDTNNVERVNVATGNSLSGYTANTGASSNPVVTWDGYTNFTNTGINLSFWIKKLSNDDGYEILTIGDDDGKQTLLEIDSSNRVNLFHKESGTTYSTAMLSSATGAINNQEWNQVIITGHGRPYFTSSSSIGSRTRDRISLYVNGKLEDTNTSQELSINYGDDGTKIYMDSNYIYSLFRFGDGGKLSDHEIVLKIYNEEKQLFDANRDVFLESNDLARLSYNKQTKTLAFSSDSEYAEYKGIVKQFKTTTGHLPNNHFIHSFGPDTIGGGS